MELYFPTLPVESTISVIHGSIELPSLVIIPEKRSNNDAMVTIEMIFFIHYSPFTSFADA
jgi:hypothetical protein